ncbi:DUF2087 domain-containing protein [Bacillus sp. EB106-08-02-XG196]|uniref:DUF2087 domain-containing protein n=1 Tax=Bacillus sp. EB106-08-02-XG196 TaxID=2737049 RepID=UPI0015C49649|nr:DUF2087 domain-containing protein [Bacillus sp. EB106-08-02-XG196]
MLSTTWHISRFVEKLIFLREISNHLKMDYHYDERELNQILKGFYEDYALIRRYLVEYGFLDRKSDGTSYWLQK